MKPIDRAICILNIAISLLGCFLLIYVHVNVPELSRGWRAYVIQVPLLWNTGVIAWNIITWNVTRSS